MKKDLLEYYLEILDYENRPDFLNKYLDDPYLKRLKKVGYFCGMDYASKDIYDFKERITRYDHSLTVALLTWKCTNDIKATLAGLFHDIATPCFSHVIDYMNKDYEKQESTEEYTEKILKEDLYLRECLSKDNIEIEEIINFKKYNIVDNERPKVCADRLDGVILTGFSWTKDIEHKDIKDIIEDIQIYDNEIGFKTNEIAKRVVNISEKIDVYCHSIEDHYMMELLAEITRYGIERKIINYEDLYKLDEETLMYKLKQENDLKLKKCFKEFENITKSEIPELVLPKVKIRDLNPLVNGKRVKAIRIS